MFLYFCSLGLAVDLAIDNATVLTVSGPVIVDGTVLLEKGKISAVGTALTIPAGVPVVDARGGYLMPGIIDVHSHMGVYSWPGGAGSDDGNEAVEAFTPRVWAGDSFDPEDPALARARAGGVTTIQVLPGSANLVGGQSAILKLRPARTIGPMVFASAPRGMKMAVGENPKRVYHNTLDDDQLQTRMGLFAALRARFQAALDYRVARARKEPPPRDLDAEALLDVIDGKIRVNLHGYRSHDVVGFYRVSDAFGFSVAIFHHALDAYKVRDILVAHGTAVATWPDWWGFKLEAFDGIPWNAQLVHEAGGTAIVHSDSADHVQRLNLEAAKLVRYGMNEADALRTITLNPAIGLGIADKVGSIAVGRDADLVLYDHHPFDVYAQVQQTWIDGVSVYDRSRDGDPDGRR